MTNNYSRILVHKVVYRLSALKILFSVEEIRFFTKKNSYAIVMKVKLFLCIAS